jgi:hypothetical protein
VFHTKTSRAAPATSHVNVRPLPALTVALVTLGICASSAGAATRNLWATVNVCDTKASPNQMGVRARMPGSGKRERMYMRFTAQFHSGKTAAGGWKTVAGKGVSRWLYAGSALFRTQEIGYTFSFDAPKAGSTYLMRGLVQFQWRKGRKVTFRSHLLTAGGHPSPGADPKGFSAATCRIR